MAKRNGLLQRFLTVFGDIKVFSWPMFMVYDPGSYRVKGQHMREVMRVVQPGDILVRRYDQYLDGHFIPGYFSHVGMYVGPVREEELAHVPPEYRTSFGTGEQTVVHALAEGVLVEDLLNFCRCDGMLVLRFPEVLRRTWAEPPVGSAGLFAGLSPGERALHERLEQGGAVHFAQEAWPVIRQVALGQVGASYDFDFDFTDFAQLSCSELVFFATRCLAPFLQVLPEEKRVLFLRRHLIAPDAFVRAGLELAWRSPSVDAQRLEQLRPQASAPLPVEASSRAA
jgi:Permuted papain-like amidase enzyme, YaeF/YiiX, C92 family